MATLKELQKKLKLYKNTLVIDDWHRIVRLVDVIDGKDDYYWVYDGVDGRHYMSCVGRWIPLKGHIKDKDYDRIVRAWNLNNVEKAI